MINLLPPSYASGIRFGRRNAYLRKWLLSAGLAIAGLLLILAAGWLYMDRQSKLLKENIAAIESQLLAQNLSGVQKDAQEISGNVKLIDQVLSRQVRFSELVQAIGRVLPPGTILSGLTLSKVDGAIDLSANTVDHESAARLAANIGDPKNELFDSVDIVSVKCTTSNNKYKCDAVYRALFSKDAKKRFINSAGDS